MSATVVLPADTDAFYQYAEPDEFETFTVIAIAQDDTFFEAGARRG
jgi:hypothetical protein